MVAIRGSRVLVTGARGLLGSHLVPRLLAADATVFGTSRTPVCGSADGVTWRQGEFRARTDLERLLDEVDPDVAYHLAGSVYGAPALDHVLPSFHSLLESTVNLLELASRRKRPRVVLAASFLEPGSTETQPFPSSGYAAAKWASSAYARMFRELYGAPVVLPMPFMVYGPHQQESKLVPHVARCLLHGRVPEIGTPDYRADWVYAGDVGDALAICGFEPRALGRTIELGSGTLVSVREVVDEIVALIGGDVRPSYRASSARPAQVERVADPNAARELLGWTATTPLRRGLELTIDWVRARC
jgi:nucleoside-diphosphate-sugar epimerase